MTGCPRKLLLVDFEPRNVRDMVDTLVPAGYEVEVAHDGMTALDTFRDCHPDGVVVEAMLPKKDGFQVCREVKRDPTRRAVPVVITTGVYRGRKYRYMARDSGCDEYLERPFENETLLGVLNRVLQGATGH